MDKLPFISVIIPCFNEERYIGRCLDSLVANSYPKEKMEVLVIDGMSADKTREILKQYTSDYYFIKVLDNPKKTSPCALNIGIKNTKGEIIMRMDAHSSYEKEYVSKCIKYLIQYNADNVGGIWITLPRNSSLLGKAIVCSLSHYFGVGNAHYRTGLTKGPRWVDTVPFGCFRKEIFAKIGFFDESLERNQDNDFNQRLRKAGGRILLAPDIVIYYYARSSLREFCSHNFINGFSIGYSVTQEWSIFSIRHSVPLIFVLSLLFAGVFYGWVGLAVIFTPYCICNIYFSFRIAIEKKDIRLIFLMPFIFLLLHCSYGLGSLCGFVRAIKYIMALKTQTAQS